MRKLLIIAIIGLATTFTGANQTGRAHGVAHPINMAFFLATNDDLVEAVETYRTVLCDTDQVKGPTEQDWLDAAQYCLTHDGEYAVQALHEIEAICQDNKTSQVCQAFHPTQTIDMTEMHP